MAASTLRRTLTTKPNSLLCKSQHFFFSSSFSSSSSSISPPFPSFQAAKSAIIAEPNPSKLADLFLSQSSTFPSFTRHRPIYHFAARKLSRANRFDLIERIIETHIRKSSSISEGLFIRFIMMYSEAGMVDNSLRLFHDFVHQFCDSQKPFCAVLTAMLNNSKFDKFHEVFENAEKYLSISPGIKAYNLKLRAYCEEGRVEMARELLVEKMEKEARVSPDIHSFNVVLGAYLKIRDWGGFDEMVKEVLRRGLECNVTSYNHRIVRLCKDKECARAKKLLDEMVAKDVKPNAGCYNAIIHGFCRVGDLDSAKMVLDRMIKDGYVAPCSSMYYTLFRHMVQEGEVDLALGTCKEILRRKWVPPFEAMESLVKGLVDVSKKDEANQVVEKMKKRLKGPALDSWGKIEAALPL